ncbi:PIN domain-like protein [Serratia phage vB_SmaP-Kaonashi]|nr:PIN domain-like protein [Serratia phage vB_SmaP-Kaonashi]
MGVLPPLPKKRQLLEDISENQSQGTGEDWMVSEDDDAIHQRRRGESRTVCISACDYATLEVRVAADLLAGHNEGIPPGRYEAVVRAGRYGGRHRTLVLTNTQGCGCLARHRPGDVCPGMSPTGRLSPKRAQWRASIDNLQSWWAQVCNRLAR